MVYAGVEVAVTDTKATAAADAMRGSVEERITAMPKITSTPRIVLFKERVESDFMGCKD